jgi:hypothetical protein
LTKRGENELALEDIRKEFVAQQVPSPLRSNAQPEPSCEVSGAVHSNEPMQVKASGPLTIKLEEASCQWTRNFVMGKSANAAATGPRPSIQWSL